MSDPIELDTPLEGMDIATGHALCRDLHGGLCVCEKTARVSCLKMTRAVNSQQPELREPQQNVGSLLPLQEPQEEANPPVKARSWLSPWQLAKRHFELREWDRGWGDLLQRAYDERDNPPAHFQAIDHERALRTIDYLEGDRRKIERWGRPEGKIATTDRRRAWWPELALRIRLWGTVVQSCYHLHHMKLDYQKLAEQGAVSPELRATLERAEADQRNAIRLAKGTKT